MTSEVFLHQSLRLTRVKFQGGMVGKNGRAAGRMRMTALASRMVKHFFPAVTNFTFVRHLPRKKPRTIASHSCRGVERHARHGKLEQHRSDRANPRRQRHRAKCEGQRRRGRRRTVSPSQSFQAVSRAEGSMDCGRLPQSTALRTPMNVVNQWQRDRDV